MGKEHEDEIEIDLKELFYIVKRRIWIIIVAGILGGVVAGLYSTTILKPIYTSSTMLYIVNKTTTIPSLSDLQLGSQLTKDYKVLVTSRPVTSRVIENLDLNMDHNTLLSKVTVTNPADTRILTISIVDTDPNMAKAIADEFAQVASVRVAEIMDTSVPNIVEEGYIPTGPTSPNVKKNVALGGVLGCFAAGFIILVLFLLNDTIRTADDIERYLGLNNLGMIPVDDKNKQKKHKSRRKSKKDTKAPSEVKKVS